MSGVGERKGRGPNQPALFFFGGGGVTPPPPACAAPQYRVPWRDWDAGRWLAGHFGQARKNMAQRQNQGSCKCGGD